MSDLSWMDEAACRGMGHEVFFSSKPALTAVAKATCSACPVLEACRDYAASTRQPCGVWGGLDEVQRTRTVARARKASPRLREEVVALAVQLGPRSAERIAGIVGRHPNTVRAILRGERRRTYAEQAS